MANFFLFFADNSAENGSVSSNPNDPNFEFSSLSGDDFIKLEDDVDDIIATTLHVKNNIVPLETDVTVEGLRPPVQNLDDLLSEIGDFLPHESGEGKAPFSTELDPLEASGSNDELSFSVIVNEDDQGLLSSLEDILEVQVDNNNSFEDHLSLEGNSKEDLIHVIDTTEVPTLQAQHHSTNFDEQESKELIFLSNTNSPSSNIGIPLPLLSQDEENNIAINSDAIMETNVFSTFPTNHEASFQNHNDHAPFPPLDSVSPPSQGGKSLDKHDASFLEGLGGKSVSTQNSHLFSLDDYDDYTDDEYDDDYFSVEDFDEGFDPSEFQLPKIDISGEDTTFTSLGGGSSRHQVHGLTKGNATTLVFILLSSLANPPHFSDQALLPHLNHQSHLGDSNSVTRDSSHTSHGSQSEIPVETFSPDLGLITDASEEIITRLRLQEFPQSFPKDCSAFVPTCPNADEGFCLRDQNYPLNVLETLISGDESLTSKYAEVNEQSASNLVPSLTKEQEEAFEYSYFNPSVFDDTHWFGPEGYICPSKVSYSRLQRAKNAGGEWKVIVNDGERFTQTVRMETCLYPNTPCRLVAPCFRSQCVQKYSYQRLLSFDPCHPQKGLHLDIFRLPSACSCYSPDFLDVEDLVASDSQFRETGGNFGFL